jgi:hypothetical protein
MQRRSTPPPRSPGRAAKLLLGLASALSIAAALVAGTAYATVMVEVPLEDMVRDADLIVRGTVERTGVRFAIVNGHPEPHTITELRVTDVIHGTPEGEIVTIEEIGGVTGQAGLVIAGTPQYHRGEDCIVFLHHVPGQRGYRTLQMAQGHFEVIHGVPGVPDVVQRDTSAIGFASWANGQMTIEHGGVRAMELEVFVSYLEGILENLRHVGGAPSPGTTASGVPSSGATGGGR